MNNTENTLKVFRVTLKDLEEYSKIIFTENDPSLPGIISMKAYEILKEIKDKDRGYLAGRMKKSIIGGVLYISQFYFMDRLDKHITQRMIAGKTKITEVTVRNLSRKIEEKINTPPTWGLTAIRRKALSHTRRIKRKYPPKTWFDPSYDINALYVARARARNPLEVLRRGVLLFIATIVFGNFQRVMSVYEDIESVNELKGPQKIENVATYGWRGHALLTLGLIVNSLEKDIEDLSMEVEP